MPFDKIHSEEAESTDHDTPVEELHGVAPPCKQCGTREAVEDGLCGECLDADD